MPLPEPFRLAELVAMRSTSNPQPAMRYIPPQRRLASAQHAAHIAEDDKPATTHQPPQPKVVQVPQTETSETTDWDRQGDVRGVIFYLPKRDNVVDNIATDFADIDDEMRGHPVVAVFMTRTGETENVGFFPVGRSLYLLSQDVKPLFRSRISVNLHGTQISSFNHEGPYQPGTKTPRYPDVMPIPLCPEEHEFDLSLDSEGGRIPLDTESGVITKKLYTLPYEALHYYGRRTNSLSTCPRLVETAFDKMVRVCDERGEKSNRMEGNWRQTVPVRETLRDKVEKSTPVRDDKKGKLVNPPQRSPVPSRNPQGNWRQTMSAPDPDKAEKMKGSWRKNPTPLPPTMVMDSTTTTKEAVASTSALTPERTGSISSSETIPSAPMMDSTGTEEAVDSPPALSSQSTGTPSSNEANPSARTMDSSSTGTEETFDPTPDLSPATTTSSSAALPSQAILRRGISPRRPWVLRACLALTPLPEDMELASYNDSDAMSEVEGGSLYSDAESVSSLRSSLDTPRGYPFRPLEWQGVARPLPARQIDLN